MQPQIKSQQYQPEDNGDLMRGVPEGLAVNHKKDNKLTSQQEADKKVKEIIESINMPIVIDILAEIKCRSMGWSRGGLDDKRFRDFLSKFIKVKQRKNRFDLVNGIELVYKPNGVVAGHAYDDFSIKLDIPHTKNLKSIDIITMLFHELLHIISSKDSNAKDFGYHISGGFRYFQNKKRPSNTPLNEGFTELIRDAIVSEYIARSGERTTEGKVIDAKEYEPTEFYPVYRILAEKVIDIIAESSKEDGETEEDNRVPRDVVVKSMLGHYMRADWQEHMEEVNKLASEELRKLFKFSRKDLSEDEMWKELNAIYKYERGTFIEKIKCWGLHLRRKFKQYKYMRPHVEAIFGRDAIGYMD